MNVLLRRVGSFALQAEIVVSRFPAVLGRGDSADVLVSGPTVSRAHCVLDLVEGELVVRDCASSNGTWVNGVPLGEGALCPGDLLSLGNVTLLVTYRSSWARRLRALLRRLLRRASPGVQERGVPAASCHADGDGSAHSHTVSLLRQAAGGPPPRKDTELGEEIGHSAAEHCRESR